MKKHATMVHAGEVTIADRVDSSKNTAPPSQLPSSSSPPCSTSPTAANNRSVYESH